MGFNNELWVGNSADVNIYKDGRRVTVTSSSLFVKNQNRYESLQPTFVFVIFLRCMDDLKKFVHDPHPF